MSLVSSFETPAERRRRGPRFGANFMTVLEVSRDLVCLCSDGVVIDVNSAGLSMLGGERDEVIGLAFRDLVGEDYAQVIDDLLHLTEIEHSAFPIRIRSLNNAVIEAELQIHPARELGGGHAVVMARDISHQGHLARTARDSEDRFRVLVEKSMHLIAQCHGGRVVYINTAGVRMLGLADASVLEGMAVAEMFHGDYRDIVAADLSVLLEDQGVMPVRLARCDGTVFDAQIQVTPLPTPGAVPEFMIEARDITAHIRAMAALRHMNETLEHQVTQRTRELDDERGGAVAARLFVESLLEAVPNPLWWKGIDGLYRGYNRAFREMHAIGPSDWLGRSMFETIDTAFATESAVADTRALAGDERVQFEGRLIMADGQPHDVVVNKVAWHSGHDQPEGVIGVMLDITERKRMEAELRRLATTDALTGIFNRRHFMAAAATEVGREHRHHRPLSLLMLDIDHFKRINDSHGHPVGDEAIKAMAAACNHIIRPMDAVGRLGGEEFAVLLPETALAEAELVAERIRAAVAGIRIAAAGGEVRFTTSVGVTQLRPGDGSAEAMLSRADALLYAAKNAGRNRVVAG